MRTSIKALAAALVVAGCGLGSAPAFADETAPPSDFTFSGYVQGVSDYRFRGYSLSGGDPAVQGSINLNHSSGFYTGAWASSLEDTPVYGHTELDLYAGWTGALSSALTADVGLLYYVYPNGHVGDANYFEPYASLSTTLGPVSAKLGVTYAWEQDSLAGEDNFYVFTDLGAGIPGTPVSVSAHVGYTDGVLAPPLLAGDFADDTGFDYSLGATYNVTNKLSIGASYVGVEGPSIDGFTDDTVVATVKLAF